jgi:hypothetical protein
VKSWVAELHARNRMLTATACSLIRSLEDSRRTRPSVTG